MLISEPDAPAGRFQKFNARTAADEKLIGRSRPARANPYPQWLQAAREQLQRILTLPEDWDSYGADRPKPEIVQSAYQFLLFLAHEGAISVPYIAPTPSGGVLFQWKHASHEMEVDVFSPFAASYVYENLQAARCDSGALFRDDADDGRFLSILHEEFSAEV